MKTKLALLCACVALLTLTGCYTTAERQATTARAQARGVEMIAQAKTDVVKPEDKVPVYFERGAVPSKFTPPEVWQNIFTGQPNARAKLTIVEERPNVTFENLAFTSRYSYGVTAALVIDGRVHILNGQADAALLAGSAQLSREVIERALLSVAKQATALLTQ